MASRICSLVIGLDFGIPFTSKSVDSWRAGFETSGLGIEARDLHDQRIVRIARTDDPGICLRIFGRQDDDAHTAVATSNRPLEVRYPLHAYLLRLPPQRRSESRLIDDAAVAANDLVFPHRHDDSSSVIADRRPTKVPTRASRTKMLERSRKRPSRFHFAKPPLATAVSCSAILHAILENCMLIIIHCMHKYCAGTTLTVLSVRYER